MLNTAVAGGSIGGLRTASHSGVNRGSSMWSTIGGPGVADRLFEGEEPSSSSSVTSIERRTLRRMRSYRSIRIWRKVSLAELAALAVSKRPDSLGDVSDASEQLDGVQWVRPAAQQIAAVREIIPQLIHASRPSV